MGAKTVLIVSTSQRIGGAALAANRLLEALNFVGINAKMLVRDRQTQDEKVKQVSSSRFRKKYFLLERLKIFFNLRLSKKHLFEIDIANVGFDITTLEEFKKADIIHLHWINQGMLSLEGIEKILSLNKPVVWTMHDMWPFTAICHYPIECKKFSSQCMDCKFLPSKRDGKDLSFKVWEKKKKLFSHFNKIHFVACSEWLKKEAKKSSLLSSSDVRVIPNPINLSEFFPQDKKEARQRLGLPKDKKLILFVAQRATNKIKGMDYLIEACQRLSKDHPATLNDTAVVILGSSAEELAAYFPFEVCPLGYVSQKQKLLDAYSSSDVYVLPSLADNLPNTIMEAMTCGVPSVGFDIGGIPEMIDHKKNGYIAKYRDSEDLFQGIWWVLSNKNYEELREEALKKVSSNYSLEKVASSYNELYESILKSQ